MVLVSQVLYEFI